MPPLLGSTSDALLDLSSEWRGSDVSVYARTFPEGFTLTLVSGRTGGIDACLGCRRALIRLQWSLKLRCAISCAAVKQRQRLEAEVEGLQGSMHRVIWRLGLMAISATQVHPARRPAHHPDRLRSP